MDDQTENRSSNSRHKFSKSGDDVDNLVLFRSVDLQSYKRALLKTIHLQYCTFTAIDLLNSLDGCVNLKVVKLQEVDIDHSSYQSESENTNTTAINLINFREIKLPKLKRLQVHDINKDTVDVLDSTYRGLYASNNSDENHGQELAFYHLDFYSQLLSAQLRNYWGGGRLRNLVKVSEFPTTVSIKLGPYKIFVWNNTLYEEEEGTNKKLGKLVVSKLITMWGNNENVTTGQPMSKFLNNGSDKRFIKNLSCNDRLLSVESIPSKLEELNLFVSSENDERTSGNKLELFFELITKNKLSNLNILVVQFQAQTTIDIKLLSLHLKNLKDLIITHAHMTCTANSIKPLQVTECTFEQCEFSDIFMNNISNYLACTYLAIDINQLDKKKWSEVFKPKLMELKDLRKIIVWSTDKESQLVTFGDEYTKEPDYSYFGSSSNKFTWTSNPFKENAEMRRYMLLRHIDYFQGDDVEDEEDFHQRLLQRKQLEQLLRDTLNNEQHATKTKQDFEGDVGRYAKVIGTVVGIFAIMIFYLFIKKDV